MRRYEMRKNGLLRKLAAAALVMAVACTGLCTAAVIERQNFSVSAAAGDIEYSEGFGFRENTEGGYSLCSIDLSAMDNNSIIIPDTFAGKEVSAVSTGIAGAQSSDKVFSLTIGKNIRTIGEYAFDGLNIDSVSVAEGNGCFQVKENILYTGDMSTLVYCPGSITGKAVIVSGARNIREDAFCSDTMEEIFIGRDIEEIPEDAFMRCTAVKKFSVNTRNTHFKANRSILYDFDMTTVRAYPKARRGEYILPATVTRIAPYAFAHSQVLSIDTLAVKEIGSYAFEGCPNLSFVKLLPATESMGEGVFSGCTGLTRASVANGVQTIPAQTFMDCTALTSLSVPSSVESIGVDAFRNTAWLDSKADGAVYIGKILYTYKTASDAEAHPVRNTGAASSAVNLTVKEGTLGISDGALRNANLKKLIIPASLKNMDIRSIFPCSNVREFVVNSNNEWFSSSGKALFNKDMTKLICVPGIYSADSYYVPSSVTEIGDMAFSYNSDIENIYISEQVSTIGISPFNNGNIDRSVVCMEGSAAAAAAIEDDVNRIYLEAGVMISSTQLTLGIGEAAELYANVTPDIARKEITWKSSAPSVASVDNGKIKALKAGTATITASEPSGKKATCKVTVCPAPSSVAFSKTAVTVGEGETYLISSILNSGSASYVMNYTSSDPSVVSVKAEGSDCRFTAHKTGSAVITVETFNGKKASCTVTVKAAPAGITLSQTQISIGVGETRTISSTVSSGSASAERIYYSTNSDTAMINPTSWNCSFTGVSPGTAYITVKTYNGKTARCKVTVKDPPRFVNMDKSEITIGKGEAMSLSSSLLSTEASATRTYRSSNSSVVSMTRTDWTASFVGQKPGAAYVTVSTYNGQEDDCKVTVKNAPESVKISKSSMTMKVGQSGTLYSSVPDGSAASTRTFRTSNSSIVRMTRTNWQGEFTAVKPGVCWVTVRTYNGKESSCKITVVQ